MYGKKKLILIGGLILTVGAAAFLTLKPSMQQATAPTPAPSPAPVTTNSPEPKAPVDPVPQQETYKGETTTIANRFSIKVPDGWTADISQTPDFSAIMFARPNQLGLLAYTPGSPPTIRREGIASWNGLTEHFFVTTPTASRQFVASDHIEVTSEPFTFDDGTIGKKYFVVKHATEAQKWGGLQKDTEWQGRTYIYEKDGERIEAHLALYPSSSVDIAFYENVARTILPLK